MSAEDKKPLPCPFCGGTATWQRYSEYTTLGCSNDGCLGAEAGPFSTDAECIEAWNRRPAPTSAETGEGEVKPGTPLPWKTDEHYPIYVWAGDHAMVADNQFSDEHGYLARMRGVGRGCTVEEMDANIKYIVHACNEYPKLKAENAKLREAVQVALLWREHHKYFDGTQGRLPTWVHSAKAALGGKQ